MRMRERPRGFWERRATFRGIFKTEAATFLASFFGAIASMPAHEYWAGALLAVPALASACLLWTHASAGYGDAYDYGWEQGTTGALREVEERQSVATRPCEILVPRTDAPTGYGYLYALKFSTGTVKVGQTRDLRRRLGEHRRDAEAFGVAIVDYWVSSEHLNYLDNEIELILACDEIANRTKREYFHGIDFAEAVRFAKSLAYHSDNTSATAEVDA